ncbi:MAG: DUF1080 domain-containing protein [Verrucomicrobiaceae bacterium]|nr:DUF1080 domain-containing protein [Verrucomicrobiaceae bacterium]
MTNRFIHCYAGAVGLAALLLVGPAPAQEKAAKPDPNREAAKRPLAILESADWQDLFNGKDLTGWTGDTEGYAVQDGVLLCKPGGKNLETEKDYSDFAFTFEFKMEENANNGIGLRVPAGGRAAQDGLEIQILDDGGSAYNAEGIINGKPRKLTWLKPWQVHGSIYAHAPAKTGYLKPVGEWNTQTIVAIEDHIMVILNGALIVDTFLEDLTPFEAGFNGRHNRTGRLTLAGHSDPMEFRNLKIAEFTPSDPNAAGTADNTPPAGFTALFNGKDLTGWKGLAHKNAVERRALTGEALKEAQTAADEVMNAHWSVADGVLTYDGKGASLCTAKDYGDFEFYCDWKIPAGADSGIYLRGTPQIQIWDPWDAKNKDGSRPDTPEEWVTAYRTGRNLGSGGLWNNKRARNQPLVLADKPIGEWNRFLIRMVGKRVSIWLNGKLVVDRTKLENYWDKGGLIPLVRADQIELQHHGSELFFKNLYIRELPY